MDSFLQIYTAKQKKDYQHQFTADTWHKVSRLALFKYLISSVMMRIHLCRQGNYSSSNLSKHYMRN